MLALCEALRDKYSIAAVRSTSSSTCDVNLLIVAFGVNY
jgi:hypothetical protein